MRFSAYPQYKLSGIEWLGPVPENWEIKRLKYVSKIASSGVWGEDPTSECDGYRVATTANIDSQGNIDTKGMTIRSLSRQEVELGLCHPGDIIVVKSSGSATNVVSGKAGLVKEEHGPVCFSNFTLRVRHTPNVLDPRFAWRFLNSEVVKAQIRFMVATTTYPNLQVGEYASFFLPLPSHSDQRVIADFLDRETARLDGLVVAKERVLGLLAEKRRALITRAVTRGLDPHAPLRDSGIAWLGEVPAHWKRAQLRRFIRFITSGSRGWAEHYSTSGSVFVRIGNLTRDSIRVDLRDIQYVDPPTGAEGERTKIQEGDLLFSITAYLGSVAVAPSTLLDAYVNQHIALVRLDTSCLVPEFVGYAALSVFGQSQLAGLGYGGTKVQLGLDDIKELWFPIPSFLEQGAIVDYITIETAKLDALRAATERTIALLKERRAALISAAVTGQIDVNGAAVRL